MTNAIRSKLFAASSGLAALLGLTIVAAPASGETGSPGINWEGRIKVASGEAYQGPWRMNESEFHYLDDPVVAITAGGVVAVAWADQSRKDIFFQIYEPDGIKRFEEPVNVSRSPEIFSWLPKMVFASADPNRVYILWQEIVFSGGSHGGEIFFTRSTDGGKTLGNPMNLSNTIAGAGKGRLTRDFWHNGSLDLAMSPEGDLYAAWTEYEGGLWFSRSTDGGENFSEPMLISGSNAKPARAPSLAVGPGGAVYFAWTVGEDRAADIHFAKSADHGRTFGEPRIVVRSEGHADAPKIALDGKGTVHLVYAESPAGPLERYHIRYAQLENGKDNFERPREIADSTKQWKSLNFPGLSLDGKDNLYIIWELFPQPISYPEGLGFTYSRDGGQTFASPAEIPGSVDPAIGSSGGRQGLLMKKIAASPEGAIVVVHSTFKSNESSHIWLFRGQTAWR
jgi:hypothetical protein